LKIDMTSFFSAEGGRIWIKFRRLVKNDMSTAVIWPKSKPEVEFQQGGHLGEFNGMSSESHLPHCRVLPPGEFNDMSSQRYVSRCRVGLLPLGKFTVTLHHLFLSEQIKMMMMMMMIPHPVYA